MRVRRVLRTYFRQAVQQAPYRPPPAEFRESPAPTTRRRLAAAESLGALAIAAALALFLLLPTRILPRPLELLAERQLLSGELAGLRMELREALLRDPPFRRSDRAK